MVLHQEPSASESISPKVARPYIQALHSINLDAQSEEGKPQEEELGGRSSTESEIQTKEEPGLLEELNAVMEQVVLKSSKFLGNPIQLCEIKLSKIQLPFSHFFKFYPTVSLLLLRDMLCITWSTSTSVTMKLLLRYETCFVDLVHICVHLVQTSFLCLTLLMSSRRGWSVQREAGSYSNCRN